MTKITTKPEITTTCQLCGRPIKMVQGRLAHHGYQRPTLGWQTASCSGARELPYELSCDLIEGAIERSEQRIATLSAELREFETNPPASFTYTRRDAYGRPRGGEVTHTRPDDFRLDCYASMIPGTYACHYASLRYAKQTLIKQLRDYVKFLRERLAAWVAPTAAIKNAIEASDSALQTSKAKSELIRVAKAEAKAEQSKSDMTLAERRSAAARKAAATLRAKRLAAR